MNTIIQNYTFDPTNKTITFTDYSSIKLENIIRIVNLTRGVILYDPREQEPRHFAPFIQNTGTVAGNVFTFNNLPTPEMAYSDNLLIEYHGGTALASDRVNEPSILSSATALAANTSRKGWMIQNTGTNPLFVLLGTGASTSVFHVVLKGGTGASDGLGASFSQLDGAIYTGIVTIAGTSPAYVVTELT